MAARLQLTEQGLQEKVRKNISQFSQNVRLRLEMETNFKQGFDGIFDNFIGKPLPNPEILRKIQEEEDPELLKKKEKEANDQKKPKTPEVEFEAMNNLMRHKAKLDELQDPDVIKKNIRAQLKAIKDHDQTNFEIIQHGKEGQDMQFLNKYLGEEGYEDDEVDIDELNKEYKESLAKSAYQEFWQDLNQIRAQSRGSQSASKRRMVGTPKVGEISLPDINGTFLTGSRRMSMQSEHTRFEDNLFTRHLPPKNRPAEEKAVVVDQKAKEQPPENSAVVDKLKRELKQMTTKLENERKTNKIYLKAAKIEAKELYEGIMQQRMDACKKAYNEEFEILAKNFENVKNTLDNLTRQKQHLTGIMEFQEAKIVSLEKMIYGTGYDLVLSDKGKDMRKPIEGHDQGEILDYIIDLQEDPQNPYPQANEIYHGAEKLLSSPFQFFGLSVTLNSEQMIDIQNRTHTRYYKMHINELIREKEAIVAESSAMKALLNGFKLGSEMAERKIRQLEAKESIAVEERERQKVFYKNRIKRISQDYIEHYKKLSVESRKYKELVMFEVETHEMVRQKLEEIIKSKDNTISDLRECLSIPRQHFKFIERLTTEEIVKQKHEILTTMSAEMGIPAEVLISKMYYKEAKKLAKVQVQKGLAESEGEEDVETHDQTTGEAAQQSSTSIGVSISKASIPQKKDLKPSASVTGKQSPSLDVLGGVNKLQREVSYKSLATADTSMHTSSLLPGKFHFGVKKAYKQLGEMSGRVLGKRNNSVLVQSATDTVRKE